MSNLSVDTFEESYQKICAEFERLGHSTEKLKSYHYGRGLQYIKNTLLAIMECAEETQAEADFYAYIVKVIKVFEAKVPALAAASDLPSLPITNSK